MHLLCPGVDGRHFLGQMSSALSPEEVVVILSGSEVAILTVKHTSCGALAASLLAK